MKSEIYYYDKRLEAARARLSGLEHSELLLKFLDHLESGVSVQPLAAFYEVSVGLRA
ncbi:MAG: hypothetical protein QXF23_07625 [Candidatus Bathyarchaeia archaeon]